jgi:hypothetical protein
MAICIRQLKPLVAFEIKIKILLIKLIILFDISLLIFSKVDNFQKVHKPLNN